MRLILATMLLVGCTHNPKFKIGDCLTDKSNESWERETDIYKVIDIGNKKYLLEYQLPKGYILFGLPDLSDTSFTTIDEKGMVVTCP